MRDFKYYNPAEIIFGSDSQNKLKEKLKQLNVQSLLLIYSGEFIKDLGIWDVVNDACTELNIKFNECSKVVPNPKIELVRELIALGKQEQVDFLLAVGGGSSIDTAKAVSLGINSKDDVWDYFLGTKVPTTSIDIGVISTLPASGSETSNAAILSNHTSKLGFEDNMLIPKFAIMNPTYTLNLPSYQTSCGIADILSHLLERYFSDTKHVDTTDYLIEGAIKALLLNGLRIMKNPQDYNARAEVQWLASIAHNNLLDTGRVGDWGSHRIEHEISAQYDIAHGEGMAIVLVAWTKYVAKIKPFKLAQLSNRIYNIDCNNYSTEEMALMLSDKFKEFFKALGLKTSLREMNIDDSHFEDMALRATSNDTTTVGHYLSINKDIFIEILNLCM